MGLTFEKSGENLKTFKDIKNWNGSMYNRRVCQS